jgi:ATP-dependent Lhr-like helicase
MVYESRVGDLFTLGTSTWRIEDITHDRVLVTPAPGCPAGCRSGRATRSAAPPSSGRAVGAFVREVEALTPDAARERVKAAGLDDWAADNLLGYLREQREATGHVPRRPRDRRRAVPRRAR